MADKRSGSAERLSADLEGMYLQSQHAAVGSIQQENYEQSAGMLPVSTSKIPPDMSHAVMQQRMADTSGIAYCVPVFVAVRILTLFALLPQKQDKT